MNINNTEILLNGQYLRKLYDRAMQDISEKYELSKIEIDILLFLKNNVGYDTSKDIVELRGLTRSHVSAAVHSLQEKGLLCGERKDDDRRQVHLSILPAAADVVKEAREQQQLLINLLSEGFTAEEKEIINKVIKKLNNNVQKAIKNLERED